MRIPRATTLLPGLGSAVGQSSLLAGLGIFIALIVSGRSGDLLPSPERLIVLLVGTLVLAVIMVPQVRPYAPALVVLFLVIAGFALRWMQVMHPGGSDVLPVTNEALGVTLGGGDPYDHFYTSSRPAGAPFPYPPVNLLIHLPGYLLAGLTGVRATELVGACVVMVAIARMALGTGHSLAVPMLALYAGLPDLLNLVGDGSNDTSSGAMFLLFVLALVEADREEPWRAVLAGVLAACALGTKQSSLPLVVAGSAWLFHASRPSFRRYATAGLVTLFVVSVPFLLRSGLLGYVKALTAFAGFHEDVYGWNIWVLAGQLHLPVASREDALAFGSVVALAALALVALIRYRSVRTALVAGCVAMEVMFLAQRWTAYSYFAQLLAVVVVLPLLKPDDWRLGDAAPAGEAAPDARMPPATEVQA